MQITLVATPQECREADGDLVPLDERLSTGRWTLQLDDVVTGFAVINLDLLFTADRVDFSSSATTQARCLMHIQMLQDWSVASDNGFGLVSLVEIDPRLSNAASDKDGRQGHGVEFHSRVVPVEFDVGPESATIFVTSSP